MVRSLDFSEWRWAYDTVSELTTTTGFSICTFRWCPKVRRGGRRKCAILWRHRGHGETSCVSST